MDISGSGAIVTGGASGLGLETARTLAAAGAHRRYIAGANLAWIAWPGALDDLSGLLASAGLSGLVLRGATAHLLIGARQDTLFRSRITAALDPRQRFLPYE